MTSSHRASADGGSSHRAQAPGPGRRRARTPRTGPRWYRTARGQALLAAGVLAFALLVRVVITGPSDDDPSTSTDPTAGLPRYGGDWTSVAGRSYRITVVPLPGTSARASAGDCIPVPGAGYTNARFVVRIENRSKGPAPVPAVDFGANLNAAGAVDTRILHLPKSRTDVELSPRIGAETCALASHVGPEGRKRLAKGQVLELTGVVGGVAAPVPTGLTVIVRYLEADPARGSGSRTAELLAPFPAFAGSA